MQRSEFWQASIGILFRPASLFSHLRTRDLLLLASLLQLTRWMFLSWVTMTRFAVCNAPALFPIPFGMELQDYRYFEIFAYLPYGLAIILFIAYEIWLHGRKHASRPMPFLKVWEVVALAYFAPWLPTVLLDHLLLSMNMALPAIVVPLHIAVVAAEAALTAVGLQKVFGIPGKSAVRLGAWGGVIFLVLAGLAVR